MDITSFVRELLFNHDCVIVPGFGGFIGNYTPAQVDKSTGTFYPPVKRISFNRNLNHNDGLLVGRISADLNINYVDARTNVEKFVTDIRKKLESGEKVIFDHIGTFRNNQEGSIQFEPDRTVNYHLDSYGLEPFQCSPLEGYDVRKRVIKHVDKEPVRQFNIRKILWRAAIVVPLLAAIVAVPLKTDILKPHIEASTLNPLVTAEFEHNKIAVDENEKNTSDSPAIVEKMEPEAVAPTVITSTKNRYQLITGSFRSEINARKQVVMLEKDGFTPEIIESSNGFFRVSAIVCEDIASAEAQKARITSQFPEAWILRKK